MYAKVEIHEGRALSRLADVGISFSKSEGEREKAIAVF